MDLKNFFQTVVLTTLLCNLCLESVTFASTPVESTVDTTVGKDFRGAILNNVNFHGENLSHSNFFGATITGADFGGANLSGANLMMSFLDHANLQGANLEDAMMPDGQLFVKETGVSIDQTNLRLYDSMVRLSATVTPYNASFTDVTWTSSDPSVAAVDNFGFVTPISKGKATITATTRVAGLTASCNVEVNENPIASSTMSFKNIPVIGIKMDTKMLTLNLGATTLSATVLPENATDRNILWSSSDDNVASVDKNGLVIPHKPGTIAITASTEDGNFKAYCIVSVMPYTNH